MKSILMSIKPQYVAKILNGEKTIEIRKRFPKKYRGLVYIYCTKSDEKLFYSQREKEYKTNIFSKSFMCLNKYNHNILNGKVIARFYCDNMEEIFDDEDSISWFTNTIQKPYILSKMACLDDVDISNYLNGSRGYAIHISQLEIFDKPKELSDFFKVGINKWYHEHAGTDMPYLEFWNTFDDFRITKAPQSMMYVEEIE